MTDKRMRTTESPDPGDLLPAGLDEALRTGRLSRRDLVRYGLGLGLSGSALSMFLAACGDDDESGGGGSSGGQGKLIDAAPDGADLAKPEPFQYASEEMTIDDALAFKVPKADEEYTIAYMLISLQGYYFVAAAYGADEAGKAAGVKIDRIAAEGYASPDVQQRQLGDLLQKNVDAVVVLPADVNGSVALVDQAQGAGIVMTVAGSLLNSNKVAQAVQSDYALGQQSADLVAERLDGGGGPGLIMGGPKQATWAVHRVAGFNARVQEKYPEMDVAVTTHQNFVDPAEGLNTFQDAIQRQSELSWIYAVDYNLLEAPSLPSKYKGKTPYVGMGLYGSSKAALEEGVLAAVLGIMPVLGAQLGVSRAVQLLNGEDVPAITVYPAPVYTKDNLDAPETRFDTYPDSYKV